MGFLSVSFLLKDSVREFYFQTTPFAPSRRRSPSRRCTMTTGGSRARQSTLEKAGRREVRLFRRGQKIRRRRSRESRRTVESNEEAVGVFTLSVLVFFPSCFVFPFALCVYIFSDLPVSGERRPVPPEMRRLCELALGSCPPRSALRLGTC